MVGSSWDRVPIDSQSIDAPLSRAAVFLTLTVAEGRESLHCRRSPASWTAWTT